MLRRMVGTLMMRRRLPRFGKRSRMAQQLVIAKVTLKDNVAETVGDGNTSGPPREDSLAIALLVIPRAGVKFVRVGKERIAVE